MSNEPKHTATPWQLEEFAEWCIQDKNKNPIADCSDYQNEYQNSRANAARIVQCVNEYDGLIETIESLRAERAELIEALRLCKQYIGLLGHYLPMPVETTLAKYEKP